MTRDYQQKVEIESNKIIRYLTGNLNPDEQISLDVREVLERLPLYPTQDATDDEEFEFKGLSFDAPDIGKQIEASFWILHDELQVELTEEIRQHRESRHDSNQPIIAMIDGHLQIDSRPLPFNPDHSLKISYLLNEYFKNRYARSEHSEQQVESGLGKQFSAKYNTYYACSLLPKYCIIDNHNREMNFRKLPYCLDGKPKIFRNKQQVALFFLALNYTRNLYVFQGWPIEERVNVRHLFEDEYYYVDPCRKCRGGIHINERYMMAEFDKNSNSGSAGYKVFAKLWKDFDNYPTLENPSPPLPDYLQYKRLKTNHQNTPSP